MIKWTTETRKIKSLKAHAKNPRILTKFQHDHLKTSLSKFGIADKPIINIDGTIIGGHQRLKVLKELGFKEIEVLVPDRELTGSEVDEMNIRLNRGGDFDFDILANEYEVTNLIEWGFASNELGILVNECDENMEMKENEKIEECKCPTCGKKMKK